MSDRRKMFPAPRHILVAAVAGVIAGAVAVYVSTTLPGNKTPQPTVVAVTRAASPDDKLCAAKVEKAKAVGAAATGQVAAMMPADPPQSLKTLAFNDPQGKPMTIADHAGRTLLVNLWATWCAPCRAEMPALDALEREMGGEEFEVVAINVDTGDDTKPKKFLEETGVASLGHYRDNTLGVFNDLKKRGLALGLPVTLLIDGEGCLLANMNGPAEWASPDARKLIEAALAK
ncbi:TlpA family protein disulfide reductase [Aminobacter anthyllidis]|uniref:TlpA family protein disulfide reductase n=1 Tax=Aminobacter anthyllidis TaxID=1035067 RepID=A0A9X1ACJ9_9HYPH|nr:TlpA disulfide reductase family protein [Aminobacter anthyllidis]MBT1157355.1 TlpA family protein disulfide reductase [Aminobacter anthyllidis]